MWNQVCMLTDSQDGVRSPSERQSTHFLALFKLGVSQDGAVDQRKKGLKLLHNNQDTTMAHK